MKNLISALLSSQIAILALFAAFSPSQLLAVPDWSEQVTANSPEGRLDFGMSFNSSNNTVIIFGGDNGANAVNDTWTFNGLNWSQLSTTGTPSARDGVSMVYDPVRANTVMFGGRVSNFVNSQTWTLSGSTWTQRSPGTSPSARRFVSMTFDATNNRVLMFGGQIQDGTALNDLWSWNGSDWTDITPGANPPARFDASMAYDPDREVVVLFGGSNGTDYLDDTWELPVDGVNPETWSQKNPANSPSTRTSASMAYDTNNNKIFLFGGRSGTPAAGSYDSETWTYNGTNWTEEAPANNPGGRGYAKMVFKPTTNQMVLFGGVSNSGLPSETWVYGEPVLICPAGQFGDPCADCPGGSGDAACNGNGTCDDGASGSGVCSCGTGFTGSDCSTCASNFAGANCNIECPDCGAHGNCNAGLSGDGTCACETNFTGNLCDECTSNFAGSDCSIECANCGDHGTCNAGIDGDGSCTCDSGFAGADCSVCASDYAGADCSIQCPNCGEHGSCDAGLTGTGSCTCVEGYLGTRCEFEDLCLEDPCDNDATCSITDTGAFSCACIGDYEGETCAVPTTKQAAKESIKNAKSGIKLIDKSDAEEFIRDTEDFIAELEQILESPEVYSCQEKNILQTIGKLTRAVKKVRQKGNVVKAAKVLVNAAQRELQEARKCPPQLTVCHVNGKKYKQMDINQTALDGHLKHGDYVLDTEDPLYPNCAGSV